MVTEPRLWPWKLAAKGTWRVRLWASEQSENFEATFLDRLSQNSEIAHNRSRNKVKRRVRTGFQKVQRKADGAQGLNRWSEKDGGKKFKGE